MGRELTGRRHGTAPQTSSSPSAINFHAKGGSASGLRLKEFWAVHDVSFELKRGECLGLIGRNGAGKTTLLKMLNGLIKPDEGRIEMRGRVGALIALGAGFNPILTGRENIYVNGSVLGLSKREIDSKLDEIIEFSQIGDFIDTPVQNYSSGMSVRLGFSVAVVLIKPDILLLDEVLAVGDMGFVSKCLNAVFKLMNDSAVVFVSHNMQLISWLCNRVIVMKGGRVEVDTLDVGAGVDAYHKLFPVDTATVGTGEATVKNVRLVHGGVEYREDEEPVIGYGNRIKVRFEVIASRDLPEHTVVFFQIDDGGMSPVVGFPEIPFSCNLSKGAMEFEVDLGIADFRSGRYSVVIGISGGRPLRNMTRRQGLAGFRVFSDGSQWGKIVRKATVQVRQSGIAG